MIGPASATIAESQGSFTVTEAQVVVMAACALLAVVCVLFHYEVMNVATRLLPRIGLPRRPRIVVLILVLLAAHVVEVWFFALVYWQLSRWPSLGALSGAMTGEATDYVYFSATCFTTLGFGDIVPSGALRVLAGTEALLGLGMITWSASLAFLQMQRDFKEYAADNDRS